MQDSMILEETQQQTLVTRLNRIEGQIRGIRRMVQEPRLCIEILQQLAAAEAALNRIRLAGFKHPIEAGGPEGGEINKEETPKRLEELVDIFDRFSKLALRTGPPRNPFIQMFWINQTFGWTFSLET